MNQIKQWKEHLLARSSTKKAAVAEIDVTALAK